jgi:hypothetical protein
MTTSRATRETSSFLVYGVEAYLPPKTLMGSPWAQYFDESMQEQLRREDMDFINERRWQAATRMHDTTKCSSVTASGSCIVRSSGSETWS